MILVTSGAELFEKVRILAALITGMCNRSDAPLGEEAVVLPLLAENNPLSAAMKVASATTSAPRKYAVEEENHPKEQNFKTTAQDNTVDHR